jgi:ubiquitin carboxyl-terminal hydrolase 36/42
MTCEMTKHIKLAHNHNGDTIKPIYICRRLKSIAKHFTFGRQEDAHEFLRYVIDNMWRSCLSIHEFNYNFKLDPLSKETTAINQIFGGYHRSQVICFQCKEKSNTYDYFMDFMLDIKVSLKLLCVFTLNSKLLFL